MLIKSPELPPLLCQKGSKFYCLFTYKNAWDPEKRRSYRVSGETKVAGTITSGSKSGEIKWNENFLEEHPELNFFKSVRNENGKIEFTPLGEELKISLKDAMDAKRLAAGATWVFDNLLADTPLIKALNKVFGMYNLNRKILSICYFLNICEGKATTRYEHFAETHRLPWQKPMSPSSICKLFQSITSDKIDKFIRILNQLTIEKNTRENKNKYWALDSTSISTNSAKLSKAAWGHNKDGDNLRQFNVMMVVNQSTGEPAYFRTVSGNVPDISTVKHFLQEHSRIQLDSNTVIVADKGYGSVANIHRFYQNNVSFLLNLKTGYSICTAFFNDVKTQLLNPVNYYEEIDCHAVTVETKWAYPANFSTDCRCRKPRLKDTMFVHIYYNQKIYNDESVGLTKKVAKIIKLLKQGKELSDELSSIKEKMIVVHQDNEQISCEVDNNAFNRFLNMKGVRILVSNSVSDPVKAFKAYYDRNEVEYAFNLYKQRLGGYRFRVSSDESLEGKAFVQFIATSIAIMLRRRIDNALKNNTKLNLHYDSEPVVIDKLNTIIETRFSFGSYFTEAVGNIRELLIAMDIPIPSEEYDCDTLDFDSTEDEFDLNDSIPEEPDSDYQFLSK